MWNIYNSSNQGETDVAGEYEVIEDPEFLYSIAFDEVRGEMRRVMEGKGLNDEELDQLIKETYPTQYKRLWGELYDRINTDIWGKYQDGVLTVWELEVWNEHVGEWKKGWMDILKKIKNQR